MHIPEDLLNARSVLEKAESETDPKRKIYYLKEGIEVIDEYLEDNPNAPSDILNFIKNLKRSHTRRLLVQLISIKDIDIETWVDYIILLITKLKDESDYAKEQDQELDKNLNEFLKIWKDVAIKAIESSKYEH